MIYVVLCSYRLIAVCCVRVGCLLPVVCHLMFVMCVLVVGGSGCLFSLCVVCRCLVFVACCWLVVGWCSLCGACRCALFVGRCSLFVVRCVLFVGCCVLCIVVC